MQHISDKTIIILYLLAVVIFLLVVLCFRRKIIERIQRSYYGWFIPGPTGYIPFIYNGIEFFNKTTAENFELICNGMRDFGTTVRFWLGSDMFVGTIDLELIEKVLSSNTLLQKTSDYNALRPWLNDGLLVSSGSKWLMRRKILTPAFHFSILDIYIDIFDKQTNTLVKNLENFENKLCSELEDHLALCALDIIFECTVGTNVNAQNPGSLGYEFAMITKELDASLVKRLYSTSLRFEFIWKFSAEKKHQDKLIEKLHSFTAKIIKEKREKFLSSGATQTEFSKRSDVYGSKVKKSFLDILLQTMVDGKSLSDEDIREEVDTFIFEGGQAATLKLHNQIQVANQVHAQRNTTRRPFLEVYHVYSYVNRSYFRTDYHGHDTTKSGLLFTLYNIAKYPHVQQQCFNEIKNVFGCDKTTPTTNSHLNDLRYLELVIKESLRLYPSVPLFGRTLTEPIKLESGLVIPTGCALAIPLHTLGRSEKIYSDPEDFKPERFEMDEFKDRSCSAFQYIPFSAGPRNCIGQKFAMLEIKTTISKILRYYEVSLSEETINSKLSLAFELVLKPKSVMEFYIKQREY